MKHRSFKKLAAILMLVSFIFATVSPAMAGASVWMSTDTGDGSGMYINNGSDNTASGDYSTAMGFMTTASGESSTAMGNHTTASGESSTAMGNWTNSSGKYSTAMGSATNAVGNASTAMGAMTNASGAASTAMGMATNALRLASTAMGEGTTAVGEASTAMGVATNALGVASTAMGLMSSATGIASFAGGGTIDTSTEDTIAGGTAYGDSSFAFGIGAVAGDEDNEAGTAGTIALGNGAQAVTANSVALGNYAKTRAAVQVTGATINGTTYNFSSTTTPIGVVAIGNESNSALKQLIGVANGRIEENSTDAVNGGQIYDIISNLPSGGSGGEAKYGADSGTEKTVAAGRTLFVKGGKTALESIGTSPESGYNVVTTIAEGADENVTISVALSPNAAFDEVRTGESILDGAGLMITDASDSTIRAQYAREGLTVRSGTAKTELTAANLTVGGESYVTAGSGINANTHKITNVAAGGSATDAVNWGQILGSATYNSGTLTLKDNNGNVITTAEISGGGSGEDANAVHYDKDAGGTRQNSITLKDTADGTTNQVAIKNVADGSDNYDAVNVKQLNATNSNVAANADKILALETTVGNASSGLVKAVADVKADAVKTVSYDAATGKLTQTTINGTTTEIGTITGGGSGEDANAVHYDTDSTGAKQNSITLKDKDGGTTNQVAIKNVADGSDDYDAVNVKQLNAKANKATTLSGYGITDAYTKTQTNEAISTAVGNAKSELQTAIDGKADALHVHNFAEIANKPTTLEGYGITDAYTKAEVDDKITSGGTGVIGGGKVTGKAAEAKADDAVALAGDSGVSENSTAGIAIGKGAIVGYDKSEEGRVEENAAVNSIAIGVGSKVTGANSIAIGTGHVITGKNSGAFGDPNHIYADNSYAIGNNNTIGVKGEEAAYANNFVLGSDVTIGKDAEGNPITNSVALGSGTQVTQSNTVAVGGRTISGLADGTNPTDAATVRQVDAVRNQLGSVSNEVREVGAISAALAGLHFAEPSGEEGDKLVGAVAYGGYRGANAEAIGLAYKPNPNMMLSASTSISNGNDSQNAYNVGFSLKFGKGETAKTKAELQKQVKYLNDKNSTLESTVAQQGNTIVQQGAEIQTLRSELEELKKLIKK